MRFIIFISLIFLFSCSSQKTVLKQAKKHISVLASDEFHGRGYTNDGLLKAENYLAEKFKLIGLNPVYTSYKQPVVYPINILKGVQFSINDSIKSFGNDYIISPTAQSEEINSEVFLVSNDIFKLPQHRESEIFKLLALNKGKIPVLDFRGVDEELTNNLISFSAYLNQEKTLYDFPALIQIQDKLTHGLSGEQDNFIIIQTAIQINENDKVSLRVEAELNENFKSHNIVGNLKGVKNDSAIFITAHFDHLGQVNNTIFHGANDNASGVSMLLQLAEYFTKNPTKHQLYFYAFTGEEAGLQGAMTAVENLPVPKEKIKFLINLDILGTGDEGIQVVNSKIYEREFNILNTINKKQNLVEQIKLRGEACNSDHCAFHLKGIPSFFIYTLGGIAHYHDPLDKPETLPLTDYYDIYKLLIQFIERL